MFERNIEDKKFPENALISYATSLRKRDIHSAYCLSDYRGKGIAQNRLNYIISTLKTDGYHMLGVYYKNINPTPYAFSVSHGRDKYRDALDNESYCKKGINVRIVSAG